MAGLQHTPAGRVSSHLPIGTGIRSSKQELKQGVPAGQRQAGQEASPAELSHESAGSRCPGSVFPRKELYLFKLWFHSPIWK